MHDHPCLSCILPDCDERSKHCALRAAIRTAQAKAEADLPLTERERLACAEIHVVQRMKTWLRAQARSGRGASENCHA